MRLFTAIELPEAVRTAVHAAAAPLLRGVPMCRPVRVENLHVTVRFLGEVAPERLPEVCAALRSAAATVPAVRLRIEGFGVFPHGRRQRVIWVGVGGQRGRTAMLECAVTSALETLGFAPEERDWSPHVTVARIAALRGRGRADGDRSPAFVPPPEGFVSPPFHAEHLTLFASELGARGPTYRVVDRFPLAQDRPPPAPPPATV